MVERDEKWTLKLLKGTVLSRRREQLREKIKPSGDFAKNGQKLQIVEMGERRSCRWYGLACNTQNSQPFYWINIIADKHPRIKPRTL